MKQLLTFLLLILSIAATSQESDHLEYAILFGSGFQKSEVSLEVNGQPTFRNYRLGFKKAGNLSVKQSESGMTVFYNGRELHKTKVSVEHLIKLTVDINGQRQQFSVDLRKGNIVLFNYNDSKTPVSSRKLSMEQRQEVVILM